MRPGLFPAVTCRDTISSNPAEEVPALLLRNRSEGEHAMPGWLAAFLIALFVGTLVEYWGHRVMHAWLLKKRHARHHRDGAGQGWLGEFRDYFLGSAPVILLGGLIAYFVCDLEAA